MIDNGVRQPLRNAWWYWRWLAMLIAIALYAWLAHRANTHAQQTGHAALGAVLALTPLLLLAIGLARQARAQLLAWSALLGTVLAIALAWPYLMRHFEWLFWSEHAGSQAFLCIGFLRTLRVGQEPMCSRFARLLHGELTPQIASYTRRITQLWAGFFGAMATVSTLLFFAASMATWSVFANFLTAPLIAAMFVGEYAARHWLHPDAEHARLVDLIQLVSSKPKN